jgi:hypothetical protein
MIRHDIIAGLLAPVEMLISEAKYGVGTVVTYVRVSSLMVIEDNPPLLVEAHPLDAKGRPPSTPPLSPTASVR